MVGKQTRKAVSVKKWQDSNGGVLRSRQARWPSEVSLRADGVKQITLPMDGVRRARTIVSRSRARSTGKYPSWKVGRMVQWESSHELNAFRLLDADPSVRSFQEQPLRIDYELAGEPHLHYPDVLVERGHPRELWEIKTAEDARNPFVLARSNLMTASLPAFGYSYHLVVAEDLAAQPRLNNVVTLLKYGRKPLGSAVRESIRQLFLRAGHLYWSSAINGDLGPNGRAALSRLVLEGVITFDMTRPITAATRFESSPRREEI